MTDLTDITDMTDLTDITEMTNITDRNHRDYRAPDKSPNEELEKLRRENEFLSQALNTFFRHSGTNSFTTKNLKFL